MYSSILYMFSSGKIFNYKSSFSSNIPKGEKYYSTNSLIVPSNDASKYKFFEWFTGLTDAEGCFLISFVNKGTSCSFKFEIGIHKDDVNMLHFIREELGIGRVATFNNAAYFTVTAKDEIIELLKVFALYPLKSNKALNYLNFEQAFELYINNKGITAEVLDEIKKIKSSINNNRTDFDMSDYYKINSISITPNWLLGFVEGDGTFFVLRRPGGSSYSLVFGLGQSNSNLYLMEAIRDYFNNLPYLSNGLIKEMQTQIIQDKSSFAYIYFDRREDRTNGKHSDLVILNISRTEYLKNVFIPLFDSLDWHSKKYLYYQDWKSIFEIKEKGLHCLPEGKELIDLILSQMNTNRLSTTNSELISREELQTKIDALLSLPNNYEIKEDGRIRIISENKYYRSKNSIGVVLQGEDGDVISSFKPLTACAESLGKTRNLITRYMLSGKPLLINNKLVYIKRVENSTEMLESSVLKWLSMGSILAQILFNS